MRQLLSNLTAKPHKLFFFGGIANAIITMAMLLLQYQGVWYAKIVLPTYHAYTLIFAVFTQFFAGFLLSMFPRFLAMPEVPRASYLPLFLLLNTSSLLFAASVYSVTLLTAVASTGMFAAYLMMGWLLWRLYVQSSVTERSDAKWILTAFGAGAVSHLLFLLAYIGVEQINITKAAIYSGFFLYLFMLIATLSQKMIPLFTEGKVAGYTANRSRYFLHSLAALLLIKVVLLTSQLTTYGFLVDGLLLLVMLRELIRWRLPFFKVEAILWVLYLSLIWVPIGFLLFFIDGLSQFIYGSQAVVFERVSLHVLAIGYFTTILIGFGTRIVLGHAGQKPVADSFTIVLFCLVQLVVVMRIAAGVVLNSEATFYMDLISASALLWLLLFGLWSKRYGKLLFQG